MKQIRLNSKLRLPTLETIFVSSGCIQDIVKDDKPLRSTVLTSGAGYCCGADFWPPFRKWFSCVALVSLICTLAISGCTSKNSGDLAKEIHGYNYCIEQMFCCQEKKCPGSIRIYRFLSTVSIVSIVSTVY